MQPLFSSGSASGPYEAIQDAPHFADVKVFLEELWTEYCSYADQIFLREIRKEKHFYQRLWELHLGCTLLQKGHKLTKVENTGKGRPDFLITLDHKKVWIEAIAPMVGTGNDAVPSVQWNSKELQNIELQNVPQEQIILRFIHAIREKLKQYKIYLKEAIIQPDDCYIIAISGRGLGYWHTMRGNDIPYIIRAVLPYGTQMVGFGREPDDFVEGGYSYRDEIKKKSGSPRSTDLFLKEDYAGISAIIYSEENLINIPKPLGQDFFLYLHNPLAKNKLRASKSVFRRWPFFWT